MDKKLKNIYPIKFMLFNRGFTLIELVVVIAIVGILSGLIILTMSDATESAKIAKSKVFSNSIRDIGSMNMISEWEMEGGLAKDTWNSNDGSVVGATLATDCVSNGCLNFDGDNDYIDFGTSSIFTPTDYLTISVWVNFNSLTSPALTQYIISRGRDSYAAGYHIDKNASNRFEFRVNLDDVDDGSEIQIQSTTTPSVGKWYNVVATYDYSVGAKLYVDGKRENSSSLTGVIVYRTQGTNFTVGVMSHSFPTYFDFNGKLDDIRIYNSAIPVSQIRANYLAGLEKILANGGITQGEYDQRIAKLNSSYAEN